MKLKLQRNAAPDVDGYAYLVDADGIEIPNTRRPCTLRLTSARGAPLDPAPVWDGSDIGPVTVFGVRFANNADVDQDVRWLLPTAQHVERGGSARLVLDD